MEVVGSWSDITERKRRRRRWPRPAQRDRAPARELAGGDLQLQGDRRLRADLHQPEHQGPARLRPRGISQSADFWMARLHPGGQPAHHGRLCAAVRGRAAQPASTASARRTAAIAGSATSCSVLRDADGRSDRGGRRLERHHRPQAARRGAGRRAGPPRAPAVLRPAVIYSFKATGDFAPTFVSQNIRDWLGYEPNEYLENPDFWWSRVHPDDIATVEGAVGPAVPEGPPHRRVPVPSQETAPIAG